ncbi:hypothetical protein CMUS01_08932 [Colletotrichum musicola]|uniref:Uncharacterized protein n=1 Tax=Colletotrichum musicola TaxID=2175873 RepID=A0A8H6NBN7_9PEZI|nr:hypothetical protein CMUS01_08932 [Colletotrichum musicola]
MSLTSNSSWSKFLSFATRVQSPAWARIIIRSHYHAAARRPGTRHVQLTELSYSYGKRSDNSHHNEYLLGPWTNPPTWPATLLGKTWLQRDRFDHWALNPFAAGVKCMAESFLFQTLVVTDQASGGTVEPPNLITPPEPLSPLRSPDGSIEACVTKEMSLGLCPDSSLGCQRKACDACYVSYFDDMINVASAKQCRPQLDRLPDSSKISLRALPHPRPGLYFQPASGRLQGGLQQPPWFRTLGYVSPANVYWDITCGRIAPKHLFDGAEEVEAGREQV